MKRIDYAYLETLINTQVVLIKKDLGIQGVDVNISMHRGTHEYEGRHPLGLMNCTVHTEGLFGNTVTDIDNYRVTVYPANISKMMLGIHTHKELCGIVVEALAHELRHVYQRVNRTHGTSPIMASIVPYEYRDEEVDAREYAHMYTKRASMTNIKAVQLRRNIGINIAGLAIGFAIRKVIKKK